MKKILAYLILANIIGSNLAYADLYIGAQGGVSHSSSQLNANNNVTTGLLVGYQFSVFPLLRMGVETELNYLNSTVKLSNQTGNLMTIPFYATANISLPLGLNLTAKAGYAYNRILGIDESLFPNTLWRPAVAIGMGYQVLNFNIFFQSSRYFLYNRGEQPFADAYTFGVSYAF
ncbi:porin family protein [Cysteiniphilum halobium]|uniref:outer membrane beta-barrel protein n=1 Tax=Cysteiniphilum halobium TaxID=2219059 RepID=UPI0013C33EA0|nr:outer membrane beta-barrel protein [Cysteiniphilum halobium]